MGSSAAKANGKMVSVIMLECGFFSALGSKEHNRPNDLGNWVQVGIPLTTDENNGVRVVYDERGWPWVSKDPTSKETALLEIIHNGHHDCCLLDGASVLVSGARVPHSNDGGWFLDKVLPGLMHIDKK